MGSTAGFNMTRRIMAALLAFVCAITIACGGAPLAIASDSALEVAGTSSLTAEVSTIEMYRMYNPWTGEHLYTKDANEKEYLVTLGWRFEGIGWWAPASSSGPVYRLYNPYSGDHHYTMDKSEYNYLATLGWRQEGVGWYSDDSKTAAIYRQFNPYEKIGTHNFTTDKSENDYLPTIGWRAEGIAWYATKKGERYNYNGYSTAQIRALLNLKNGRRANFAHGSKSSLDQRYIVLHDTEEWDGGDYVVRYWASRDDGVAAHFIVDRDGTVWQCIDMDQIGYHAGASSAGMPEKYNTNWMNGNSIGIEISHVGGQERYTEAQLRALDTLIAYIDSYYGFYATIIDHKMWRAGNPDTSPEFAGYLANYRSFRKHVR